VNITAWWRYYLVVHKGLEALNDFVLTLLIHFFLAGKTHIHTHTNQERVKANRAQWVTRRQKQSQIWVKLLWPQDSCWRRTQIVWNLAGCLWLRNMGNEICFTVFWGGASPACPTGGPDPHVQNSAPSWEKQTKQHVNVILIMCQKN